MRQPQGESRLRAVTWYQQLDLSWFHFLISRTSHGFTKPSFPRGCLMNEMKGYCDRGMVDFMLMLL